MYCTPAFAYGNSDENNSNSKQDYTHKHLNNNSKHTPSNTNITPTHLNIKTHSNITPTTADISTSSFQASPIPIKKLLNGQNNAICNGISKFALDMSLKVLITYEIDININQLIAINLFF